MKRLPFISVYIRSSPYITDLNPLSQDSPFYIYICILTKYVPMTFCSKFIKYTFYIYRIRSEKIRAGRTV